MATRIIQLGRSGDHISFALWASVPSGQEPRYRSRSSRSAYLGISATDLSALQNGIVAETVGQMSIVGLSQAQIDAALQSLWQQYQTRITDGAEWAEYGRLWDGTTWTAGGPALVPPLTEQADEDLPTFFALSPSSGFAANRFHLVLWNATTFYLVRVRFLVLLPQQSAVTGVASSAWTLRRRRTPTTVPAGGLITPISADSMIMLPPGLTIHAIPTTAPGGGTAQDILTFVPQADEQKLSPLDGPTFASLQPFGGMALWSAASMKPAVPLVIRPQETLEVQQSATAGTGNVKLFMVFSVKDAR